MLVWSTIKFSFCTVSQEPSQPFVPGTGEIIEMDNIIRYGSIHLSAFSLMSTFVVSFDHVPLVTPNGDVLVQDLTFEVKQPTNRLNYRPMCWCLGTFWHELSCLWTQWLRQKLALPHSGGGP